MKVMQVMESSATGTLSMVCLIANKFARDGHEVHVIYSIREETPKEICSMFDGRVRLTHIQMSSCNFISAVRNLRAEFKSIKPDVIHLHSSNAGFIGRISALFLLKYATVLYSPHCISFMRRDISWMRRWLFIALERLASLRRSIYVACSESERFTVICHMPRQPVVVVENAVKYIATSSCEGFTCQEREVTRQIVTVGGIRPQKNPELFARIASAMRDSSVRFVWIGDGVENLKKQLLDAGVEVTGWLDRIGVDRRLATACIYVSTSLWEGMPVSVIEAMFAGVPVVVSNCAGNADVVMAGTTGLAFEDAEDAIRVIRTLLDDRILHARLAGEAKRVARGRFSEERFFEDLAPLYAAGAQEIEVAAESAQ